ncbi:MAG: exonuclease [Rubellimicrobium sp.]|nr:exonuclease [Rubellimicrobium sp.]
MYQTDLKTFRFVALDVETANGWPGSICQIGLAFVAHDGTITGESHLIDPEDDFSPFNTRLHGIGPDHVHGQPPLHRFWPALHRRLARQPVVSHSRFDPGALAAACRANRALEGLEALDWVDSVQIARRAWPEFRGAGGHGLGHLKERLNLDFRHHDAAEDARAAALVVLLAEERLGMPFLRIAGRGAPEGPT